VGIARVVAELTYPVLRNGEPIGEVVIPDTADASGVRVDGFNESCSALAEGVLAAIHEEWEARPSTSAFTMVAEVLPHVAARMDVTFVN